MIQFLLFPSSGIDLPSMKLADISDTHKTLRVCRLLLFFAAFSASEAISQPDSGSSSPSWLQLSFEQRTKYEQLSNPFRPIRSGTERYFPLRTRLRLEIGEAFRPIRAVVEFQDSRVLNDQDRICSPPSYINEHDLLQAHLQFNSNDIFSSGAKSRILVGRFTMDLGKRRLVARNKMRNTTNSFDGISWTLAGHGDWVVHSFLTRPVNIDPYSWDVTSRRYFWGIYFTSGHNRKFLMDAYYFGIHDGGVLGSTSGQKHSTVGGRAYRLPETGSPDYEVEYASQFGKNGQWDHQAYFFHGEAGFTFRSNWKPRISLHYDYASGDKDPEDTRSEQFNPLGGARSFEFGPTGIYGPIFRSNMNTPGVRLALSPAESLRVFSMYRAIRLAQAKNGWVGSGLSDPTGSSGKSIGQNFDTRLQWQAKNYLLVELGYARFFKGSFVHRVSGIADIGDSNYFYASAEFMAKVLPF